MLGSAMYGDLEGYGREIARAEEALSREAVGAGREDEQNLRRFFTLVQRGPQFMRELLSYVRRWNSLPAQSRLETAKGVSFFRVQIAGVMETGGRLLLRFQRDERSHAQGPLAITTFREALERFISTEAELSGAYESVLRKERELVTAVREEHESARIVENAHELGVREIDEGLGLSYERESFWTSTR
jgi:hypothetical protein